MGRALSRFRSPAAQSVRPKVWMRLAVLGCWLIPAFAPGLLALDRIGNRDLRAPDASAAADSGGVTEPVSIYSREAFSEPARAPDPGGGVPSTAVNGFNGHVDIDVDVDVELIRPGARMREKWQPTGGLRGRIIFVSAGHGMTFYDTKDRQGWAPQRPVLHSMLEDFGNVDQMNLFVEFAVRAGATVVPLRPVGRQPAEHVLDNDDAEVRFEGEWAVGASTVFFGEAGDVPYRVARSSVRETARAIFAPFFSVSGRYPVYCWARHGGDRISQLYRVRHAAGETRVRVPHDKVGNGWVYLGSWHFEAGRDPARGAVVVSNLQARPGETGVVVADAVRFGNGMGDVARGPADGSAPARVSGYPREDEAARYWIQRSLGHGQSPGLYDTPRADPGDNVGAPIRMAREMNRRAGGHRSDRVYVGFHSNAGGARGVVGLFNNERLFPGTATPHQRRLAFLLASEADRMLGSLTVPPLETEWAARPPERLVFSRSDYAFGEIRDDVLDGEMDASIIETGFHDDPDDAVLLRDPLVRGVLARAAYQALVRYFHERAPDEHDVPLIFVPGRPLNPRAVAVGGKRIVLEWDRPLSGAGGDPTGYVVRRSASARGDGFGAPLEVFGPNTTRIELPHLQPDVAHFFDVRALNRAGESPSSAVVGCRFQSDANNLVLVVDGFTGAHRRHNPRQIVRGDVVERVMPDLIRPFSGIVPHGRSLSTAGVGFDSCSIGSVRSGEVSLGNYAAVVWAFGDQEGSAGTFDHTLQDRVTRYVDLGGHLFISGSNVVRGLEGTGEASGADVSFLESVLRVQRPGDGDDDALSYRFRPVSGGILDGEPAGSFDQGSAALYQIRYPDRPHPVQIGSGSGSGSAVMLDYVGGLEGPAAVQYDGSRGGGRVLVFGFPFESITSAALQDAFMTRALQFFDLLPGPLLAAPRIRFADSAVSIQWPAIRGRRYQLQSSPDADAGPWRDIGPAVTARSSLGRLRIDGDSTANEGQFFRVVLLR